MSEKSIRKARIIHDVKVYRARNVSPEHGRKVYAAMKERGEIHPDETATGRNFLSFDDAEKLASAL